MHDTRSYDVVVVGAGFAGATAARDLRAAGRSVLVVEARDRVGGRTLYRAFPGLDVSVEYGGTWIDPTRQPSLAAEVDRYGVPLAPGSPAIPTEARWELDGSRRLGGMPVPPEEVHALDRVGFALMEAVRRIDRTRPLDRQGLEDLDVSTRDFLAPLDLPPATTAFLNGMLEVWLCSPLDRQSMMNGLLNIAEFAGSPLAYYSALSATFADGTSSVVEALLADGGADVRTSWPVVAVDDQGADVVVTSRDGEDVRAGTVVFTAPVNTWNAVDFSPDLNDDRRAVAAEGHAGSSVKVWALVEGLRGGVSVVRGSGPLTWAATQAVLGDGRQLVAAFGCRPDAPALADDASTRAAVGDLLPDARVVAVDRHDWSADPHARGAWPVYRPGQITARWSGLRRDDGRVVFAGADVATSWTGWIEGAISSGRAAAERVLAAHEA